MPGNARGMVWALVRIGQSARLIGNDQVDGYVLLATACDGTLATTTQFTSVRVVCNNTLRSAVGDRQGAIEVPIAASSSRMRSNSPWPRGMDSCTG